MIVRKSSAKSSNDGDENIATNITMVGNKAKATTAKQQESNLK